VEYVILFIGCVVVVYGYHKLLQFLKWLNSFDNSLDHNDNW